MSKTVIKKVTEDDITLLLQFIHELADYEKATHRVEVTPERLSACLFNDHPYAHAVIAYHDGQPAGYAIYFFNYSSYAGKPGIYLEDVYVKPELRGKQIGKKFLAYLSRIAQEKDCAHISWSVLEWNQPAIEFYQRLGASNCQDILPFKLAGEELKKMAAEKI